MVKFFFKNKLTNSFKDKESRSSNCTELRPPLSLALAFPPLPLTSKDLLRTQTEHLVATRIIRLACSSKILES